MKAFKTFIIKSLRKNYEKYNTKIYNNIKK